MQNTNAKQNVSYKDIVKNWGVSATEKVNMVKLTKTNKTTNTSTINTTNKTKQIKPNYKLDKQDIKSFCSFGEINKLYTVPNEMLTEDLIKEMIPFMKHKLQEIQMWEQENQNQNKITLQRLANRSAGIQKCIAYLKTKLDNKSK